MIAKWNVEPDGWCEPCLYLNMNSAQSCQESRHAGFVNADHLDIFLLAETSLPAWCMNVDEVGDLQTANREHNDEIPDMAISRVRASLRRDSALRINGITHHSWLADTRISPAKAHHPEFQPH